MITTLQSQGMEQNWDVSSLKGGNMDVLDVHWAIAWILGKMESLEQIWNFADQNEYKQYTNQV